MFRFFGLGALVITCFLSEVGAFSLSLSRSGIRSPKTAVWAKEKDDDMIEFMNAPMDSKSMVGDAPAGVPPERDELADLVRCAVRAADGRKAENIVALRVSSVSTLTTFVVIVSGNSRPQNQAIAAAIKKEVNAEYDLLPGSTGVPEGNADSGWIVLDYGGIMVNVMTPKSRLYYNVEGQWQDKGGEEMNLSDVIIPNTVDTGSQETVGGEGIDDDPFWA